MKKVLITGGAGFIGSSLTLELLQRDYDVTILDNLSKQVHGNGQNSYLLSKVKDKVKFIEGSVVSRDDLLVALEGQEIIVHLAAETGTGQSMYEIERYCKVNVLGTSLILDILANTQHCISKFIVASSRSIYGEGKYYDEKNNRFVYPEHRNVEDLLKGNFEVDKDLSVVATDEDSLIHPSSVYGITKYTQEQLVMTVCPTLGINPVSLRYQNVYGPGQSLINPYTGILSIFSSLILKDEQINIFEDGNESRDFIYIDDVVSATILSLESQEANNQIFNVGSGMAASVKSIAELLYKHYGKKPNYQISGNFRLGDIRHNYADIAKINGLLGYLPSVSLDHGIESFCKWVLTQTIENSTFDESMNEMKSKGLLK